MEREEPCTVIQTSLGELFYSHDRQGQRMMLRLLQNITDHYFDPNYDLGPLRIYEMNDIPDSLRGQLNETDNLHDYVRSRTSESVTDDDRKHMRLRFESDMAPTATAFSDFIQVVGTQKNLRNVNIYADLAFLEKEQKKQDRLLQEEPSPQRDEQLAESEEMCRQHIRFLTKFFDIRGLRSVPLILNNPDWIVKVDDVDLNIYQRSVIRNGHCLFIPEQQSVRKNHSYAWLSEDRLQILFSDTPPTGKQTYRVEVKFPSENNDRNHSEQFTPQQTTKKNKITR